MRWLGGGTPDPGNATFLGLRLESAMAAVGSSFFTVPAQRPVPGGPDSELVVWLRGQHDASNQSALCLTLAHAIALGGPGLVLDLAQARAISPSTLAVIVRAREFLRQRSAWLTVRSPSARVRRLIDDCGLDDLLGPEAKAAAGVPARTLGRWAPVPAAEAYDVHPSQPDAMPRRHPARRSRSGFENEGRALQTADGWHHQGGCA